MKRDEWRATVLVISGLLFYWTLSVANLDRWPPIHNDETAVIAAGYKLFDQGVYGLDMYTGHQGRETVYLEVMPLMPWLQGLSSRLLGVGVWPMRFVPVLCGLLTLALIFALGRQLVHTAVGLAAMGLLLFWQWSPLNADPFHASGIALLDSARIGRYDILIAPFTLAVLIAWLPARRTAKPSFYFLTGSFIGLAGLANLYGFFWLPALLVMALWSSQKLDKKGLRSAVFVLSGVTAVLIPWLILIIRYPHEFTAQFAMHSGRFGLLDPRFYLDNVRLEGQRYALGLADATTLTRLGFWLVLLVLMALVWLGYRARHDERARYLFVPCVMLPLLLALLIQKKSFGYLLLVMPLWCLALAWAAYQLWHVGGRVWRSVFAVGAMFVIVQGSSALWRMQQTAVALPAATPFFSQLRQMVPADGRIIGPQTFWPGFYDREYRSFILGFALARPEDSFAVALTEIAPDIVLLDETMLTWLADYDRSQTPAGSYTADFWHYLAQHHAQLVGELHEPDGQLLQIYALADEP